MVGKRCWKEGGEKSWRNKLLELAGERVFDAGKWNFLHFALSLAA